MVKLVLGQVQAITPIVNRRASVSSKLLASGHKSMLKFFVPEYNYDSEIEEEGRQEDLDQSRGSEEHDSGIQFTKKILTIEAEELALIIYDYPSDCLLDLECLLDYFIKTSEEIVPTASGYICTILESLFKDDNTVVEAFRRFFSKEKYLERLFRHLDLTSVTNFFSHALLGIKPHRDPEGNLSYQTIYYRTYLANRLAKKLLESDDLEVVENLTSVMKKLVNARGEILDSGYLIRVVILGVSYFGDLVKRACKSVV
jgi:hypothetical protein